MKAIRVKSNSVQITLENNKEEAILFDALKLFKINHPRNKMVDKMFWPLTCCEGK